MEPSLTSHFCTNIHKIPPINKLTQHIMKVDTTDFSKINMKELFSQIEEWMEKF
jgi:hypothetical protein